MSSSVGAIIKTDTIDNIYRCFTVLTSTVKLKLLLGILHLPRRNMDEMKHTIEGLVELALEDTDQWVRLVADVVKTYPIRGKLNIDLASNGIAASVIEQLREKVDDSNVFATLPLECQYVNKNALQSLVGSQPPPVRHFALRRKPKSAALRVDLMQRSSEASSQAKKEKTVPVKHRDMTRKFSDASPMRGIPKAPSIGHRQEGFRSQTTTNANLPPSGGSRSVSRFRSERGTKLLDISEQPLGIREQKRRKKQQQEEEINAPPSNTQEEKPDETPDYAAGLPQTVVPSEDMDEDVDNQPESDSKSEDEDKNDVDMEDEEYEQGHYPPESPENNSLSTIDQEQPSPPESVSQPMPEPPKPALVEKRPSVEELPVYAMPATPSPYFRPVTSTINPVVTTASPVRQISGISGTAQTTMLSPQMHSNVMPPARTNISISYSNAPPPSGPTSTSLSNPMLSRDPPPLISPPRISVGSDVVPEQRQLVIQSSALRQASSYPQTPGFYAPIIRQQASQLSQQTAQLQRQQPPPVGQSNTLMHPNARSYTRPVQLQPNAVQYVVRPNLVQLQQGTSHTPGFSAAPNPTLVSGLPQNVPNSNAQVLQHQLQMQQARLQQQQHQQHMPIQQNQIPKKTLVLTREQMDHAQEMFKTANRLSRQEKSIILGFMAGSRDNPAPDKGDVLQITLSEHEQLMKNPSGGDHIPVLVETYFEMNYRTGDSAKKQRLKQYVAHYNSGNVK